MAKAQEQSFYDELYRKVQESLPEWYRLLIPELRASLRPDMKIVELGCGQAPALRLLAKEGVVIEENIHGLDQSRVATEFVQQQLPRAHFAAGDIYDLPYDSSTFDICLLMETIEHLTEPLLALQQVRRVLKPGGQLYVSFPNYMHLPWLFVRILSEMTRKHNWILLQPVEKIYVLWTVRSLCRDAGFKYVKTVGSHYGWPLLDKIEPRWLTRLATRTLNACGLHWLSFHPIQVFQKPLSDSEGQTGVKR